MIEEKEGADTFLGGSSRLEAFKGYVGDFDLGLPSSSTLLEISTEKSFPIRNW